MIDLSVVIPTFDRGEQVERCLEHLTRQTLPSRMFEVVVADDASTDDTEARLRRWERDDRIQVRYLRCEKGFAGGARNRGSAVARGNRILFLGDDILPTPDLLSRHLEGQQTWGADAVLVGEVRYASDPPPNPFMRWLEDEGVHHDFPTLRSSTDEELPGRYFYACNASVPARALRITGGFDERIKRAWEDTELGVRLERSGFPLRFLPGVTGLHVHPTDLRRYLGFLRAGRPDVVRAIAALRDLGTPVPTPAAHRWLDRLVTDSVVDAAATITTSIDQILPAGMRSWLYRRMLRYERRRALLAVAVHEPRPR